MSIEKQPNSSHSSPDSDSRQTWLALENNPALRGIPSVWQSLMGPHFEILRSAFFHKLPDPAIGIFCEKCYCTHEVIDQSPQALAAVRAALIPDSPRQQSTQPPVHPPPRPPLIAVCRCEDRCCPQIILSPADIEVWALNWQKLARALCQALGLDSKFTDLKLFNTYQIGAWSADAVPVILTILAERHQLKTTISELSDRLRCPYILLAPTNDNLDASSQESLARQNAAFFPLDTTVRLSESGMLHSVKPPGELFAKFTPQPKEMDEDVAARAFALVSQFDADDLKVFKLYCLEGLSASQVAQRCHCSKATVMARLKTIRTKTGMDPRQLRRLSPHFSKLENQITDSRARHIHRTRLVDED